MMQSENLNTKRQWNAKVTPTDTLPLKNRSQLESPVHVKQAYLPRSWNSEYMIRNRFSFLYD